MNETQSYQIKPYARLLTMLGYQLISNARVALVVLVKNSYDADASWVKISFNGFREIPLGDGKFEIEKTNSSSITIEDDGCGMTMDTIKKHWLNPATPEKKNRKKDAARLLDTYEKYLNHHFHYLHWDYTNKYLREKIK